MTRGFILPERKQAERLKEFIYGRIAAKKTSGTKVAREMYLKQRTFSYKLTNMTFTPEELILLFKILEVTPEELPDLLLIRT